MAKRFFLSGAAILLGAGWPLPAFAHAGTGLSGGLTAGLLHPLSGPDHLLAMVAVGLWGAFLGRPLIIALPVIFPTLMALGAVLGMLGVPVPRVELGIAISVIVLGSAILFAWRAPIWAACLLVAVFALFHGYAHGVELPSAADPIGYSAGFVSATGVLHLIGIGIGEMTKRGWFKIVARAIGGLIAAAGGYFLLAALG